MIRAAVAEVTDRPVALTISVPGGEAMAAKTSNARLGIVGGISILGTTGIVRPFSTAAWRASVVQQVDVAAAQGQRPHRAVHRRPHRRRRPAAAPRPAGRCASSRSATSPASPCAGRPAAGMARVTFVGMAGKITKLAAGVLMTHYRRSKVDGELLAEVARADRRPGPRWSRRPPARPRPAISPRPAWPPATGSKPLAELCRRAAAACQAHVGGALAVEVVMVDFEGDEVLARG